MTTPHSGGGNGKHDRFVAIGVRRWNRESRTYPGMGCGDLDTALTKIDAVRDGLQQMGLGLRRSAAQRRGGEVAGRRPLSRTRLGKLALLGCLAPDIVTAIVEGRQPATLTAAALLAAELPLCWSAQRQLLGFA